MTLHRMEKGFFKELYLIRALSWFWQIRFLWQQELHLTESLMHLHFLSDKQFGRGTWKILVLPRCCGDEQLLSHWVWRLQERQLLSGTFGSSGWIGFLRTVCSEFQLLSPKCKVLSQKSCSWITSVKLGGSRRPLSTSGFVHVHILALLSWFESFVALFQHFVRLQVFPFSAISRISTIFDFLKQRPQSSPAIYDKSFHCTLAS